MRKLLGPGRLIGLSTHSLEQAAAAADSGADYIGVGPIFQTTTKPTGPAKGAELLTAALAATTLPVVAIGGITLDNVGQLVAAGARRVAVCQAILSAPDPAEATRGFKQALGR